MSSLCDFGKITFCDFTACFSFLTQANILKLTMYLCPNMINFDRVPFSERRSEEVISFF